MNTMKLNLPGADDFSTQEAYKALRTNLQFCGQDVKIIEITAHSENEGKTIVSLQIARSFAELNKKVLLIDADMRKSVMAARNTSAITKYGLSEYLSGQAIFEDCIWATDAPTFHVMFAGQFPPNPVELLNSAHFKALLEKVRAEYDYIIIDTPPLGRVIDAAVIAPVCDGCAVVVGDENLKYAEVEDVIEQITKSGCRILGVIKNRLSHGGKQYYSKRYYGQ